MSGWEAAQARASNEPDELPSGIAMPARAHALVVVDHFDPTMIDCPVTGARLLVRPLSRLDAMDLARQHDPPIVVSDRILADVEKELGMSRGVVPRVAPGHALLVRTRILWNDVRWHLVSYEGDAG